MRRGRYYLGRVIKLGQLNSSKLMDAIAAASTITIGKFAWTITDVEDKRDKALPYVFGRLSKFHKEGHVTIVDTVSKSQIEAPAKNLLIASAPFVYLPNYSGIAYLHVWNGIQEEIFPRRFKTIIEATYNNFFVDCSIEPVADYRAFVAKLRDIDLFLEISAKVYPPNPLYGRLWESLKEYVKKRNASELSVKELSEDGKGLKTDIISLLSGMIENSKFKPEVQPDITDAAILMAADGYGRGKVIGQSKGNEVIVRTSETQKSFLHTMEPEPQVLAEESNKYFKQISKERDMGH